MPGQNAVGIEYRSRRSAADRPVVAGKPLLAGVVVEPRGGSSGVTNRSTGAPALGGSEEALPKPEDKPFATPKQLVWAWRRVKANEGAPGWGSSACRSRDHEVSFLCARGGGGGARARASSPPRVSE